MSLSRCIDNALGAGEIDHAEAEHLHKRLKTLSRRILARGSVREALAEETKAIAKHKRRMVLLKERARQRLESQILGHVNAAGFRDPAEALAWVLEHNGQAKFQDVKSRMLAHQGVAHAKLADLMYEFSAKNKISGDLGRRFGKSKETLANVVREINGQDSGDAEAKALSQAWLEVAEDMRQQFNAAGGAIGKLQGGYLPQHHNQDALVRAGRENWVGYMMRDGVLDIERMRSPLTGEVLSREELKESLEYIWFTITTDGWNSRSPSESAGKGALWKQHADHRFLHFKDADSWMAYQREYGEGDVFAAMTGHIAVMTRDIAFMEILGPNPQVMWEYLKGVVMQRAANTKPNNIIRAEQQERLRALIAKGPKSLEEQRYQLAERVSRLDKLRRELAAAEQKVLTRNIDIIVRMRDDQVLLNRSVYLFKESIEKIKKAGDIEIPEADQAEMISILDSMVDELPDHFDDPTSRAKSWISTADTMFGIMRGDLNTPVHSGLAKFGQGLRNVSTASKLGSAVVTAITDSSFQRATRIMAGMPQKSMFKDVIGGYVRQFRSGGLQNGMQAGLILDSAIHVMHREARMAAGSKFAGVTGFMADRVLGLSGLSPLTQAGKHAFGLDMQAHVVDTLKTPFKDLRPEWRKFLEKNGFASDTWEKLATIKPYEDGGVKFLRPQDIEGVDRELALNYLAMIHRFTKMAVPEPTTRARAAMYAGTKPGTGPGEALRLAMQFKGFSVGLMFLHGTAIHREMAGQGRGAALQTGAMMALPLLINLTIFGAVAMQIKEMLQGRDPRPMDDPKFWAAAFMQGGGLGILGDFAFSDVNRFGGGLSSTLAGPVVGSMVDPARNLLLGNALEGVEGKDTNIGKESVRFLKNNLPGGNIWYARLAVDRLLFDTLQRIADPEADRAIRRQMAKRAKDYGQGYWFEEGATSASRAPDLANVISK